MSMLHVTRTAEARAYQVGGDQGSADDMQPAVRSHNVAQDHQCIGAAAGADEHTGAAKSCRLLVHLSRQ